MKKLSIAIFATSLLLYSCANDKKNTTCEMENERIEKDSIILGMDVSHYQGNIIWDDIKKDGVNFVYIKATEGDTFIDPKFEINRADAKKNCVYQGAYHFYVTGNDPTKQALNFTKALGQLDSGSLPPVLDLEEGGIKAPVTKENYQKNTLIWLKTVEKELGVAPIIYTNLYFGIKYLDHPDFAKYKLWVAEYTKKKPKLPETWKNQGWTFWQRTDLKKLSGVKGDIDYDVFKGDAQAFRALLKK
ncbi:glycoside hydrolase family 25 protein [Aquimarina sediminis]|uniref:glycoside hydrolase family 25 protein n=1 Tax=Aquimarina sediminis TaxID=2070536 RepID=UPI000CA057DE|nr:GH25 family lysozyme [Aquimarina sediminis]